LPQAKTGLPSPLFLLLESADAHQKLSKLEKGGKRGKSFAIVVDGPRYGTGSDTRDEM
jgi:hypothetical protein